MENIIEFVIISLAVWRIGSIVAREDSPFHILERFRVWISEQDNPILKSISDGMHCVWCNTVWIGFVFALFISSSLFEIIAYTFALSGMALFIEKVNYG